MAGAMLLSILIAVLLAIVAGSNTINGLKHERKMPRRTVLSRTLLDRQYYDEQDRNDRWQEESQGDRPWEDESSRDRSDIRTYDVPRDRLADQSSRFDQSRRFDRADRNDQASRFDQSRRFDRASQFDQGSRFDRSSRFDRDSRFDRFSSDDQDSRYDQGRWGNEDAGRWDEEPDVASNREDRFADVRFDRGDARDEWYNRRYEQWRDASDDMDSRLAWNREERDTEEIGIASAGAIPSFAGKGYNTAQKGATVVTVGYSAVAKQRVAQGADLLPAFNQAMAALGKKGGEISIESGTYALSGQMIIRSNNTWVHGAGLDKTILKLVDKAKKFKYAGFLRGTWLKDITVSDLTLDGNRQGQSKSTGDEQENYGRYGFYMDGYDNLLMTRMKIQNMQSYGFDPHGIKPDPWIWSTRLTITDCVSLNNGWDGYTLDQNLGIYVANCLAQGNGRHGFNVVTGSRNVLLLNNRAVSNGFGPKGVYKSGNGCGFIVNDDFNVDTGSTLIKNNVAQKNFRAAVCLNGPRNVTITGNTLEVTGYCAHITDKKTKQITWTNNRCVAAGGSGASTGGAGSFFIGPEVDKSQLNGLVNNDARTDIMWG